MTDKDWKIKDLVSIHGKNVQIWEIIDLREGLVKARLKGTDTELWWLEDKVFKL